MRLSDQERRQLGLTSLPSDERLRELGIEPSKKPVSNETVHHTMGVLNLIVFVGIGLVTLSVFDTASTLVLVPLICITLGAALGTLGWAISLVVGHDYFDQSFTDEEQATFLPTVMSPNATPVIHEETHDADHEDRARDQGTKVVRAMLAVQPELDAEEIQGLLPVDAQWRTVGVFGLENTLRSSDPSLVDIVLIACAGHSDAALALLDEVSRVAPKTLIVVLAQDSPDGFFRSAFAAGADAIVTLPTTAEQLRFELQMHTHPLLRQ